MIFICLFVFSKSELFCRLPLTVFLAFHKYIKDMHKGRCGPKGCRLTQETASFNLEHEQVEMDIFHHISTSRDEYACRYL